jgi:hypothetical protein
VLQQRRRHRRRDEHALDDQREHGRLDREHLRDAQRRRGADEPVRVYGPLHGPLLGSCVTTVPANDAGTGIECNPVTQSDCTGANNACDYNVDSAGNFIGFTCFPNMMYTVAACGSCDPTYNNGPYCDKGFTCLPIDQAGMVGRCARYCCTDGDCGSGKCTITQGDAGVWSPIANNLGLCTTM